MTTIFDDKQWKSADQKSHPLKAFHASTCHQWWRAIQRAYRPLSWCSHLEFLQLISMLPTQRLEEQNSLVVLLKMILSIHYCYSIRGTRPRWRQHDKGILPLQTLQNSLLLFWELFRPTLDPRTRAFYKAWMNQTHTLTDPSVRIHAILAQFNKPYEHWRHSVIGHIPILTHVWTQTQSWV